MRFSMSGQSFRSIAGYAPAFATIALGYVMACQFLLG